MSRFDDKVRAGAEWLDAKKPNWEGDIYLAELDLIQTQYCICGQLDRLGNEDVDRGFYAFLFKHQLDASDADAYGFWISGDNPPDRDYAVLTNAWKRLIRKRRKEAQRE